MDSDPGLQGLLRLKRQHQTLVENMDAKLNQLERFLDDYKAVDQLLEDLPKRLSHPGTMIPFSGKKALVPAVLTNTNEVTIYLGSDHFASVSSHHCRTIVERRMEALRTQVTATKEERSLLAGRLNFTDDFVRERSSAASGSGLVEIREDFDEEEEARWRERHRRLVVEERESQKRSSVGTERSDNDILRRLDELERLEEAEGTINELSTPQKNTQEAKKALPVILEDSEKAEPRSVPPILCQDSKEGGDRASGRKNLRVRFEGDADEEEEEEEVEEEENSLAPAVIRFRHSPNPPPRHTEGVLTPSNLIAFLNQKSPAVKGVPAEKDVAVERGACSADSIAENFVPKSVLKPSKQMPGVAVERGACSADPIAENFVPKSVLKPSKQMPGVAAVQDVVVERGASSQEVPAASCQPVRPKSRFQARRANR